MPDLLHKPTKQLLMSARVQVLEAAPAEFVKITRQQYTAWNKILPRHRKIVGDVVVEMNTTEKRAVDVVFNSLQAIEILVQDQTRLQALHAVEGRLSSTGSLTSFIAPDIAALELRIASKGAGASAPVTKSRTAVVTLSGSNNPSPPLIPAGAILKAVRSEVVEAVVTSGGANVFDLSHQDALGVEFGEALPGALGAVSGSAEATTNPAMLWAKDGGGRPAAARIFVVAPEPEVFVSGKVRITAYYEVI